MGNKTLTDGLIDRRAGGLNRFAVNRWGNKTLTDGLIDRRAGGVNRFAVNRWEIKHCRWIVGLKLVIKLTSCRLSSFCV